MFDKTMISDRVKKTSDENQRRALFVHFFDEFVTNNLKLQQAFDETAHRGKIIYDRVFPHFEVQKMADFVFDVPTNQIKALTKELERQKWLYHDDEREIEVYIDHEGWDRFIDKHDQNADKLTVGFVSYVHQHHLSAQVRPAVSNGSLAYAFLKLKFHDLNEMSRLPRSEFLDLVAYLKTAVVDYFHERNQPALLRLRAEQFALFDQLPEDVKHFAHAPPELRSLSQDGNNVEKVVTEMWK